MDSPPPPPAQGAWPPPPGSPPPPQQPYAPPWGPAKPPFSGMAVASFVTGLVAHFPLALVLGLVALSRLTDGGGRQRGKGLAIAGVTLAGVQIAVLAVVIPIAAFNAEDQGGGDAAAALDGRPGEEAASPSPTGSAEPTQSPDPTPGEDAEDGGEEINVYDIRVGDCFDSGSGLDQFEEDEATEEFTVTRLACDAAHEAEAFGSTRASGYQEFPGDEELTQLAFDECGRMVQPYVLDTWTLDSSVTFFFYYPQASSWALGDREILCFFGHQDGSPLTASLRGDESGLGEEQTRYLEITTPLEIVIWSEPLPEAALGEHRAWAAEMAGSITAEAEALAAESWSAGVSGLVDDLVAAREDSAVEWERAADAADQAEYDARYGDGYATLGVETEITIRETLGLATSLQ